LPVRKESEKKNLVVWGGEGFSVFYIAGSGILFECVFLTTNFYLNAKHAI
jgi:hypothetical protein